MSQLEPLMRRNFIEYASYVITDRAIPDLRDGLKPVQRRLLHTLYEMHDGRFHKVANVIGETMKLHPHGDVAISDALVVLANKDYFIERQGNFGNLMTGHAAAAARYIECRLTPLALETMFNPAITERMQSYDGRRQEPVALPSKLPVLLMLGPEGIAVGMATRILPHNFCELLTAQIDLLGGKETRLKPDFVQGGSMDASLYDNGRGKVVLRARIEARDDKRIVITEIPFSTTTESLIASIETAAQKGQVKIGSIDDYTTEKVEIEIALPRGVYAREVIPQLYAYTDCQVQLSSNIVAIVESKPVELTVTEAIAHQTDQLLKVLKAELSHELKVLEDQMHFITLEQLFIEKRVYKRIEKAATEDKVLKAVRDGMEPYQKKFVRPMVEEDVERLLQIRIRRISQYDIDRYNRELDEVKAGIREREKKLANIKRTARQYLTDLLQKYGKQFPRRTKVTHFEEIDKKAVARTNIKVSYDSESGFFGTKVRGDKFQLSVSEYDRILAISRDGSYRVIGVEEKMLIPGKVIYCELFDPEKGKSFTVVYRDKKRVAYAKKIKIEKFIRAKEYSLVSEGGRVDFLLEEDKPGKVRIEFEPRKYQRLHEATFDLDTLEPTGVHTRGTRLAPKPVVKISRG